MSRESTESLAFIHFRMRGMGIGGSPMAAFSTALGCYEGTDSPPPEYTEIDFYITNFEDLELNQLYVNRVESVVDYLVSK